MGSHGDHILQCFLCHQSLITGRSFSPKLECKYENRLNTLWNKPVNGSAKLNSCIFVTIIWSCRFFTLLLWRHCCQTSCAKQVVMFPSPLLLSLRQTGMTEGTFVYFSWSDSGCSSITLGEKAFKWKLLLSHSREISAKMIYYQAPAFTFKRAKAAQGRKMCRRDEAKKMMTWLIKQQQQQ